MSHKLYIGIDNGTTGSIGWVGEGCGYIHTPSFVEQSYTKAKKNISRVDRDAVKSLFNSIMESMSSNELFTVLERPRVNPMQFTTTISAVRSLEAMLTVLEDLKIPHMYCDSRDWQKVMLPSGTKGTSELKKASLDIGIRLFPDFENMIRKQKDADGLLIAEWARREGL